MAPEFYMEMPHYYSWVKVIWDFVTDPAITPFNRECTYPHVAGMGTTSRALWMSWTRSPVALMCRDVRVLCV
jgi:hypothetical protein